MELEPQFWIIHTRLAAAYLDSGQKDEALAEASKATEIVKGATIAMQKLGYMQGMAGRRDEALTTAKELERRYANGDADGLAVAAVYLGLGEKDRVFEWLEKDIAAKRPSSIEMFLEPEFRSLRSDPRFKDLRRRMGLPE